MNDTGEYICDSCGEEVTIPVEPGTGDQQEFVEDCPICCRPNLIRVDFDEEGQVRVWAVAE